MKPLNKTLFGGTAMAVALMLGGPALAEFPERPVEIVVPFAPGGAGDVFARIFVNAINENNLLPQPVVVVNMPGGGATIGSGEVRDAEPDGYTLLQLHQTLITSHVMGTSDYGPEAFEPVVETHHVCLTYATSMDSGLTSLDDIRAANEADPRSVKEATLIGSLVHFASAMLENAAHLGVGLVNVGGGAQRTASLMGGHTQTMFTMPFVVGREDSGLRGLVQLGPDRHPLLPDVPTAHELGYDVDACTNYWWLAPQGTPADRVAILADAFAQAAQLESVQQDMAARGVTVEIHTGEDLAQRIQAQVDAYTAIAETLSQ
ncbi:MAG: tripartite tricarboxylate transporter substrate binding protein [Rhodobacter sp.]|nr:tripartite tricarboxylate transporter substrate binding protein [Paracoccaceae bacterium]MCC0076259.1 tripartite tricarboxylate transporter substrate binding protein [Rhodobacter sp.]